MKRCTVCASYTLSEDRCPKCGGVLGDPSPPKFALHDPYYSIKLEAYLRSPKLHR
ncbi:MAG TPA: nucleolar RNA-binding Nop10p family protein [Thermoproteota archaeon]|nr:nucleolar RNA-binding Nop10p family protein [Thermoproteota archaeon]